MPIMPNTLAAPAVTALLARDRSAAARRGVIALIALLTTIDLFAVQALLPSLAAAYGVSAAAMGTAVNASTFGMAVGGLAVALFGRRIDRRRGVVTSLALLALPTLALSFAPDLAAFTALRVVQGLAMAAAFTLALAWLGEHFGAVEKAGAFAAYITGNVASNLFGRLIAATAADLLGLAASFFVFASLNLAGAALVFVALRGDRALAAAPVTRAASPLAVWGALLRAPALRSAFAVGFGILFAFIGTFTYVNFILVRPPFSLGMMAVGFVYLVFAPSIVTTPLAGRLVARLGARHTLWFSLAVAGLGLPLTLTASLAAMLAGLVLIGVGTFLAQAAATGFVGRAAADPAAGSGLYFASYFLGGLAGAFGCGIAFTRFGWPGCAAVIAIALAAAAFFAHRMTAPSP